MCLAFSNLKQAFFFIRKSPLVPPSDFLVFVYWLYLGKGARTERELSKGGKRKAECVREDGATKENERVRSKEERPRTERRRRKEEPIEDEGARQCINRKRKVQRIEEGAM
jgi:hypothetical protein